MNNQLQLIEVEQISPRTQKRVSQRNPRLRKTAHSSRIENETWWKLTDEERQQGLAGIRAIRAILNKTDEHKDISLAKAS